MGYTCIAISNYGNIKVYVLLCMLLQILWLRIVHFFSKISMHEKKKTIRKFPKLKSVPDLEIV